MLPNSTHLTKRLVDAHIEELRRAGARSRLARVPTDDSPRSAGTLELTITIRAARLPVGIRIRRRRWAL
jgi:hypothetical protein